MLALADHLLAQDKASQAGQILDLLSNDPDRDIRNEARFRRSRLLRSQGSNAAAAVLLRQIVDEMPTATNARLELAQLLDMMGDKDGAWRQVRAAQAAGLPPEVARVVDRYSEALRAARPTGVSIEIAIAPDSNISRATGSDKLGTVLGNFIIDEDSQAQSGTGLTLHGQAYRRLAVSGDHNVLLRASTFADLYRKPRFNDVALDLSTGPEFNFRRGRLSFELGAAGRWYGQKPYQRSVHVGAVWARQIGIKSQLRLTGTAALIDNRMNDLQDGRVYSLTAALEHALSTTTGIAVEVGADRQSLADPGYSTTGWRGSLLLWRDIERATVSVEAKHGRLGADERLTLFPERRSDRYSRLTIGATFRQLTFGDFAPVTRFVIERNHSTIEFYEFRRMRTEVGIARAF